MSMGRFGVLSLPLMGLFGTSAALAAPASETAPLVSEDLREFEPIG